MQYVRSATMGVTGFGETTQVTDQPGGGRRDRGSFRLQPDHDGDIARFHPEGRAHEERGIELRQLPDGWRRQIVPLLRPGPVDLLHAESPETRESIRASIQDCRSR